MMARVVHITLSMDPGGIESLILNLAGTIDRNRFSMAVYCLDNHGSWFQRLKELGCSGFVFHRRPGFDARLVLQLAKQFKKNHCHLVHTHNQAAHFYGGLAARLAGVPCLVTTEHSRHYIDERFRRRIEKRLLAGITDRWITVSRELADLSIGKDGISEGKLSVIDNGIDARRFTRPHEQTISEKSIRMRTTFGIVPTDKVAIAVGRLHPIKNHMMLLEATAILNNSGDSAIHVFLVGDGPLREDLRKRAVFLGIEKWVHFLGMREDIPDLLWMSDVFLLCSHSEGLPLSLLESWAAGIPVVLTHSANHAALVRNEITGKVVNNKAEALAEGMTYVFRKPEKCRAWVEKGLQQVQQRFSVRAMSRRYEDLYETLLKEKGVPLRAVEKEFLSSV